MAVPTLDAPLAQYSTNFQALGTADPTLYSLTAPQMTQYTTLHDAWMAAYDAANADGSRSRALVQAMRDAKAALLPYARELYAFIQASAAVANENKVAIGVTVRKTEPSPMPPPALAPLVTVERLTGRTVRYRLADANTPTKRRRPPNAAGALIMSAVGATPPPANDPGWRVEGQTGTTAFLVQFPDGTDPNTPCWVTCIWYNRRGEFSPASAPLQTYIQGGPTMQQAA